MWTNNKGASWKEVEIGRHRAKVGNGQCKVENRKCRVSKCKLEVGETLSTMVKYGTMQSRMKYKGFKFTSPPLRTHLQATWSHKNYVMHQKNLPVSVPSQGSPFWENGNRTTIERTLNGYRTDIAWMDHA